MEICIKINFVNKNYCHNRRKCNMILQKLCLCLIYNVVLILFLSLELDIDFSNLINDSTVLNPNIAYIFHIKL